MDNPVNSPESTSVHQNISPSPAPDVVSVTARVVQGEDNEEKWPKPVIASKEIVKRPPVTSKTIC